MVVVELVEVVVGTLVDVDASVLDEDVEVEVELEVVLDEDVVVGRTVVELVDVVVGRLVDVALSVLDEDDEVEVELDVVLDDDVLVELVVGFVDEVVVVGTDVVDDVEVLVVTVVVGTVVVDGGNAACRSRYSRPWYPVNSTSPVTGSIAVPSGTSRPVTTTCRDATIGSLWSSTSYRTTFPSPYESSRSHTTSPTGMAPGMSGGT